MGRAKNEALRSIKTLKKQRKRRDKKKNTDDIAELSDSKETELKVSGEKQEIDKEPFKTSDLLDISAPEIKDTKDSKETNKETSKEKKEKQEKENNDEIYKDFQKNNTKEFSKQNKLIDGIDTKLDKFEQKIFHSQGGEKTKLPQSSENEETSEFDSFNEVQGDVRDDSSDTETKGWVENLKKGLGFTIGSAASYGFNKLDRYLSDEDDEAKKEVDEASAEVKEVSGNIVSEKESLTPQEIEELQSADVNTSDLNDKGLPYYLKENPNKSLNPLKKKYSTSDYVENLMKSSTSVKEKENILNELKNRNDVDKNDIKKLESHINDLKKLEISNSSQNKGIKGDIKNSNTNSSNDLHATKELQQSVKKAKSESDEIIQNLNDKDTEKPKVTNSQNISKGSINNLVSKSSPSTPSSSGSASSPSSPSTPSSSGSASSPSTPSSSGSASSPSTPSSSGSASSPSTPSSPSTGNLNPAPLGRETISDQQAANIERKEHNNAITSPMVNKSPAPKVSLNQTSKTLAKNTIGSEAKPDTITNEKVINNQTIEKIPENTWNKFNSNLDNKQDKFMRGS